MRYFAHKSSVIDDGATVGTNTKIWHFCHISKGAYLGASCSLGQNVFIGENVKIGSHVKIQNNVSVYSGVTLESYVFCGPSVVFTNDINPRSKFPKEGMYVKTRVREGASIGANVTVVCGITIGKWAFIGAGSVVTRDVPNYALMYGSPAKQHGWVSEHGEKLTFSNGCAICPVGKDKYQLINETQIQKI